MVKCPVCNSESRIVKRIRAKDSVIGYEHIYDEKVNKELFSTDYTLRKCNKCKLIYADPLQPGEAAFYEWVTSHSGYYPTKDTPRWEWKETIEYIKKNKILSVLEIGCGAGDFLEYCRLNVDSIQCLGIDMTETSCDVCREKGIDVFCGTIEDYISQYPDKKYDLVVSFHCLEHVNDPKQFVEDMFLLCNNHGIVLNSLPYSDINIEPWLDCGNLPPHHMTRWCERSLLELAKQIGDEGVKIKLVSPQSANVYTNTKQNLMYLWFSLYDKGITQRRLFAKCLRHPYSVLKELLRNAFRDYVHASLTINGQVKLRRASYVVLTVLKR